MLTTFCSDAGFILRPLVKIVIILRFLIPIILIVLVTFDLFKVFSGNPDDKAKKDATTKITKRIIYALIIFLIPTIVNLVFEAMIPASSKEKRLTTDSMSWYECWYSYYNENK